MKARERFDKILRSCCDRIQEEVSALIGKPFKLGEAQCRPIGKEELFAELGGRQVLAHVRVDGELQGDGCLLVGIKDAIYIGGTLIMLPESELESVLKEQEYSEELQDSYGEVANIICGAATVTFEEQYPKNIRLIKMEQEVITPVKVVVESDQPVADVPYYLMSASMQMDNRALGDLYLLLPAVPFALVEAPPKEEPAPPLRPAEPTAASERAAEPASEPVGVIEREPTEPAVREEIGVVQRPADAEQADVAPSAPPVPRRRDAGKLKKQVDGLLTTCMAKMCEEVSSLLGGALRFVAQENVALDKETFLDQAGGKQIMTRMDIRGERQGEAYLFVEVKAAIHLGGTLIMLPESELEETVRNEEFGDDARDAYGEVTNIIAGVFTSIFEEQHRAKLGFVKTSIEPVTPVKIDPDSGDVFANQAYYLAPGRITYNDRDLGRLQLLIPAGVLELEGLLLPEEASETPWQAEEQARSKLAGSAAAPVGPGKFTEKPVESTDILLVTDDDGEAGRIAAMLEEMGYASRILHFKDSVQGVLTPRIQLIFLVMREVSEQGFGAAIKIASAGASVPLVAAGPAWTRTLVLKAVKYGASDILITPASSADVREKVEINLVRQAA